MSSSVYRVVVQSHRIPSHLEDPEDIPYPVSLRFYLTASLLTLTNHSGTAFFLDTRDVFLQRDPFERYSDGIMHFPRESGSYRISGPFTYNYQWLMQCFGEWASPFGFVCLTSEETSIFLWRIMLSSLAHLSVPQKTICFLEREECAGALRNVSMMSLLLTSTCGDLALLQIPDKCRNIGISILMWLHDTCLKTFSFTWIFPAVMYSLGLPMVIYRETSDAISGHYVLNSGTLIGPSKMMLQYFEMLLRELEHRWHCRRLHGTDQAIHNYLVYTGKLIRTGKIFNAGPTELYNRMRAYVLKFHHAVLVSGWESPPAMLICSSAQQCCRDAGALGSAEIYSQFYWIMNSSQIVPIGDAR